jgi:hypothetical protein
MPLDQCQELILVRASKSRPSGQWPDQDYDVRLGDTRGVVVGRIFRPNVVPQGRPWFWTITDRALQRPTDLGYAGTRDEAMAAFKLAWTARRL